MKVHVKGWNTVSSLSDGDEELKLKPLISSSSTVHPKLAFNLTDEPRTCSYPLISPGHFINVRKISRETVVKLTASSAARITGSVISSHDFHWEMSSAYPELHWLQLGSACSAPLPWWLYRLHIKPHPTTHQHVWILTEAEDTTQSMDLCFQHCLHNMVRLIKAKRISINLHNSNLLDQHLSAISGSEGTSHSIPAKLWLPSTAPVVLVLFINCNFQPYNPSWRHSLSSARLILHEGYCPRDMAFLLAGLAPAEYIRDENSTSPCGWT